MIRRTSSRRGFTLVELLIVIALIAIVSGMVVGLFGSAVEKSGVTVSMATQKQLVNQVNAYMQLHNQTLPDRFDSLVRVGPATTYATLGTYSVTGEGTFNLLVGDPLTGFIAQPVAPGAGTDPKNVNRGVHPDAYVGGTRVLTVKQLTSDDVRLLNSLGVTNLYDLSAGDLSYGEFPVAQRIIAVGGNVALIDPQGIEGQRLYRDFGVDLSDTTVYPRKGTDDGATAWDDSVELTDAARLTAFRRQMFYVLAVGLNSRLIGDGLAGVQEAPQSAVVSLGYYNRFAIVIKKGATSAADRNAGLAGVIDPKGRGVSAARQAINSIQ